MNGHQAEVLHFVDCIRDGKQPIATGEHGLDVIKILDAIYESATTGDIVKIS
ncbi:MAG: Gfo/Idh/MocA family oxidoreductase [Armatimonadota bacterium]